MKGHRKERSTGGRDDAAEDLKQKTQMRVNAPKIEAEADEKKSGGKVKRKRGGIVHHENMENMKHAKHLGPVRGEASKGHAGRKPRKDGGRTGADSHPFSSAKTGEKPAGRTEMDID